jgi:hypothetical protein
MARTKQTCRRSTGGMPPRTDQLTQVATGESLPQTKTIQRQRLPYGKRLLLSPQDLKIVSAQNEHLRARTLDKCMNVKESMIRALKEIVEHLRDGYEHTLDTQYKSIKAGLSLLTSSTITTVGRIASRVTHSRDASEAMQASTSAMDETKSPMVEFEYIRHHAHTLPGTRKNQAYALLVRDQRLKRVYLLPLDRHRVCVVEVSHLKPTGIERFLSLARRTSAASWPALSDARIHVGDRGQCVAPPGNYQANCQICGPKCTIVEISARSAACDNCASAVEYGSLCACTTCVHIVCRNCIPDTVFPDLVAKKTSTCMQCWEIEI